MRNNAGDTDDLHHQTAVAVVVSLRMLIQLQWEDSLKPVLPWESQSADTANVMLAASV